MAIKPSKKNVALVLSSGGARGLAHIGVIDELSARGFNITSIAGSSMGALVGGLYATGNLNKFRDWVLNLDKLNFFKLIDFTLSTQGFIKGEKVFEKMQKLKMIPDVNIEDLPIKFVAVAADIINNQEVIFNKGDLHRAIRASISIPNVFTPIEFDGGILVDGGVLNPLPINRILRMRGDMLIAVDLNSLVPYQKPDLPKKRKANEVVHSEKVTRLINKWDELFSSHHKEVIEITSKKDLKLGYFDILTRSIQLMQSKLSQQTIDFNPPDMLVSISKFSCSVFEFYKGEMIAYGREACKVALDNAGL